MTARHPYVLQQRSGRAPALPLALWAGAVLLMGNLGVLLFAETTALGEGSGSEERALPFALGAGAALGATGMYYMSGRRSRYRIRLLSRAAHSTTARSLDARVALSGPEDEIKELGDAFDAMLERLRLAFERQGRFMGDVAHELRTPLATLRTNLEVVAGDPESMLEDYRDMSAVVGRTVERLQRLVDDLLLLCSEEQLPIRDHVALGRLLEDLLRDLRPMAEQRGIALRLVVDADIPVRGDAVLLARAFGNLVENGIRYNREGGEVALALERRGGWATVTVRDTGIGMSAEERACAFDRFYRADGSRSRHTGGAGLGLSIVARIVRQHGGRIRVESVPCRGSAFTVLLPG